MNLGIAQLKVSLSAHALNIKVEDFRERQLKIF